MNAERTCPRDHAAAICEYNKVYSVRIDSHPKHGNNGAIEANENLLRTRGEVAQCERRRTHQPKMLSCRVAT
jgi:hypothetical protein